MELRRVLFCLLICRTAAFSTRSFATRQKLPSTFLRHSHFRLASTQRDAQVDEVTCWNPRLRRIMAGIAGAGVLETAYLTITKLTGGNVICPSDASCDSVLNGPYAWIPGTQVPLSLLGFVAYCTVAFLAVEPILQQNSDDMRNRIFLTALTTAMGIFSVFLMTLLFGVLKESCPFCIASAIFSIILAKLSWLGGSLPQDKVKEGIQASAGAAVASFCLALILFSSDDVPGTTISTDFAGEAVVGDKSGKLVAEAKVPPPILTSSSRQALELSSNLQALDAKMYGAYWCSHCYDQKERLGKEAMGKIAYIECSKDGFNSQRKVCNERDVPGYPTWEINGKLFPGERALDELEDIVKEAKK